MQRLADAEAARMARVVKGERYMMTALLREKERERERERDVDIGRGPQRNYIFYISPRFQRV